jgi:hypothetical protein
MNGVNGFTGGRRLGHGASFGVLVLANVLLMASTSAPSPVYPLYLQRWGFSVTILTAVFAVYVAGLIAALLTVGSLSDHLGRRPMLVASFRAPQWWQRLPATPFCCNNIRERIAASRWRVGFNITGCAIVTTAAIGLIAASLVVAAPASATHPPGADGPANHTATSVSQERDESVGGLSQRSRRHGGDNVGKVATDPSVGEPAAERDIADPQASEAWLYGHAKCKRRRGLPLLPLWCNDAAAGGLAVLPIGRRIIRVTQSASAMPAAFILPRVAVRTPPVAAT